jgi:hypothetical protein
VPETADLLAGFPAHVGSLEAERPQRLDREPALNHASCLLPTLRPPRSQCLATSWALGEEVFRSSDMGRAIVRPSWLRAPPNLRRMSHI